MYVCEVNKILPGGVGISSYGLGTLTEEFDERIRVWDDDIIFVHLLFSKNVEDLTSDISHQIYLQNKQITHTELANLQIILSNLERISCKRTQYHSPHKLHSQLVVRSIRVWSFVGTISRVSSTCTNVWNRLWKRHDCC